MLKLVEEHGTRYWALIGAKLNGRTGKQVSLGLRSADMVPQSDAPPAELQRC